MADNLTVTQAASGTTVASDDVSGVQFPRVKLSWGVDGAAVDASATDPLPTVQTGALPAGTNAIGKLAANDGVDIGDVTINNATIAVTDNGSTLSVDDGGSTLSIDDGGGSVTVDGTVTVGSQPARARTTDTIAAADSTDAIMNGTTALTPKFVIISGASSGDNTVLAAVTSKKIRVLSLLLVSAGTTTVRFESGAGGTALTGVMSLVANTGFSLPYNPVGWFETASNTLLNLELSAAIQVSGCLTYVEV